MQPELFLLVGPPLSADSKAVSDHFHFHCTWAIGWSLLLVLAIVPMRKIPDDVRHSRKFLMHSGRYLSCETLESTLHKQRLSAGRSVSPG